WGTGSRLLSRGSIRHMPRSATSRWTGPRPPTSLPACTQIPSRVTRYRSLLGLVRTSGQAEGDGGRDADDLALLSFDQLPAALVHQPVMALAQEHAVVEVGLPALDPVHQVMAVAPGGGPLAGRPAAVLVTDRQRLAQRPVDQSLAPADVHDQRVLAEQDPGHAAVAGHALHAGRGEREREVHLPAGRTGQALEGLDGGRHLEVGRPAAGAQLHKRVGHPLLAGAVIVRARGPGQGLERVAHRSPADRVEHAADQKTAVLGGAEAQAALLGHPLLLLVVGPGVERVPVVQDLVVE